MSGEQLDKILKDAGFVKAEIARLLGVPPQSVNQSLNAQDVKTGFLEDLCKVLNVDMGFFYGIAPSTLQFDNAEMERLRTENDELRAELARMKDPDHYRKESEVYNIWMSYMKMEEHRMSLNNRMLELYKQYKEG